MTARVLYFHGLEGSPEGHKPTRLRARADLDVRAPNVDTSALITFLTEHGVVPSGLPAEVLDPLLAVARDALLEGTPDVIVGSSFGGGLTMELSRRELFQGPLVLLAPAGAKLFGVETLQHPSRVAVVHGRRDEVVPVADSVRLAADSTGDTALFLVDDAHRLRDAVDQGVLDDALNWALAGVPRVGG